MSLSFPDEKMINKNRTLSTENLGESNLFQRELLLIQEKGAYPIHTESCGFNKPRIKKS